MFGYVTPCKMELKIKDYEKFKAYYCGLCKAIKKDFGNLPRLVLNYDMTFLAVLLDSLEDTECSFKKEHCIIHPITTKIILKDHRVLSYAAFCNTILSYFKLIDNVNDDISLRNKINLFFLKPYIKKVSGDLKYHIKYMEDKLNELYKMELSPEGKSIDELSHPFAELTGYIISSYKTYSFKDTLYSLGYNLGKWIYIIDAFDDLEKDMLRNKFNAINCALNNEKKSFQVFSKEIESRIDFTLVNCANQCLNNFNKLPLKKNEDLLYNILQYGLVEKMDKVFKRSCIKYEKPV